MQEHLDAMDWDSKQERMSSHVPRSFQYPSKSSAEPFDPKIGQWLCNQRLELSRSSCMPAERMAMLMNLPGFQRFVEQGKASEQGGKSRAKVACKGSAANCSGFGSTGFQGPVRAHVVFVNCKPSHLRTECRFYEDLCHECKQLARGQPTVPTAELWGKCCRAQPFPCFRRHQGKTSCPNHATVGARSVDGFIELGNEAAVSKERPATTGDPVRTCVCIACLKFSCERCLQPPVVIPSTSGQSTASPVRKRRKKASLAEDEEKLLQEAANKNKEKVLQEAVSKLVSDADVNTMSVRQFFVELSNVFFHRWRRCAAQPMERLSAQVHEVCAGQGLPADHLWVNIQGLMFPLPLGASIPDRIACDPV